LIIGLRCPKQIGWRSKRLRPFANAMPQQAAGDFAAQRAAMAVLGARAKWRRQ